MPTPVRTADRHAATTLSILDDIFGNMRPLDFGARLWDGTTWGRDEKESPRFTLVLNHPGSLRRMFMPPSDLTAGEAYIYGDFDVEGDMEALAEVATWLEALQRDRRLMAFVAAKLMRLPQSGGAHAGRQGASLTGQRHARKRDGAAIRYHYDVSNDFYRLWLDDDMVYSCAYFEDDGEDLGTAQRRKLDYICRKLRLQPGERLLDIGCGWGGLVMRAARECGVDATGITLSEAQAELANERIAQAGLAESRRVELCDYRDVDESKPFDKLVSVGMFEHVGQALLPTYFEKAWRLLRPGGAFLNHGISANAPVMPGHDRRPNFSNTYVFPDGELVPISHTLAEAEAAGFEVRDNESLREHYALTLRRWVRRLEERAEDARALTDDVTYRIWRLFMSFSAYGFEHNSMGVYQTLLLKPDEGRSGMPLTRGDWYQPEAVPKGVIL